MTLHDAIKTNQNVFFPLSLKKEQNLVSQKNMKECYFFNPATNPLLGYLSG